MVGPRPPTIASPRSDGEQLPTLVKGGSGGVGAGASDTELCVGAGASETEFCPLAKGADEGKRSGFAPRSALAFSSPKSMIVRFPFSISVVVSAPKSLPTCGGGQGGGLS